MAKNTVRKKKTVRVSRRSGGYGLMPTDSWYKAKHFVHSEVESKHWVTKIKEYIKKNYDRKVLTSVNKLPDWKVGGGSHWATTAACLEVKPEIVPGIYVEKFDALIMSLYEEGSKLVKEKKETPKKGYTPTIQERISEQAQDACDPIEEWLEGYVVDPSNFDPKGFDFVSHFANTKISQAHARKIKKYYQNWLDEARAIQNMPTPSQIKKIKNIQEQDYAQQLRDGYRHVKKANAKKWVEALEFLMSSCDLIIDSAKAARKPKVKKSPSKEKIISKLKYKEKDEKFQLVSINPLELIDATEVWVFNTKTRKLGKYVADEHTSSMSVSGTSIVGYDADKSVQKTLRKPDQILKEFKKAGKVKLRKFMDDITTTEIKLNGRINTDTIILKAS